MKRYILILSLFFIIKGDILAQDPELTQFYASPVYTNPAMAGNAFCTFNAAGRFSISYRNQWPGLPGTYRTMVASFDQHIDEINGGLGFIALYDRAGAGQLTNISLSGIYAYVLPLDVRRGFYLRAGIQGTYTQKSIDWNSLKWADQIDPIRGFIYKTNEVHSTDIIRYPNFAAGLIGYSSKFYVGLAVHNIVEPKESFYDSDAENAKVPRRLTFHSGAVIPLDKRKNAQSTISPNILFMNQETFTQLNLGFYINRGPLVTGLWFRQAFGHYKTSDALMILFGFRKDRFKFAYSTDITVSSARSAVPVSHEVTATLEWCIPKVPKRFKPVRCPEF